MKQRSLLSRLHINGICYLVGALILLLGVPLYQQLVLVPLGYSSTLAASSSGNFTPYLLWMRSYSVQFVVYRALLTIAFLLLLTLPFTLFRIIVAQEILGQQERAEETATDEQVDAEQLETDGMPAYAWRGKGFAVVAAWSGLFGLVAYLLGTLASTLYFVVVSHGVLLPNTLAMPASVLSLMTNTVGIGLLALATLFLGATIARSGRKLWPDSWVAFGYLALAVAALLSGSAVAVSTAPTQATLTSPAILLFALWVLWMGIMLVRLKPEV